MTTERKTIITFSAVERYHFTAADDFIAELLDQLPNDNDLVISKVDTGELFAVGELKRVRGILTGLADIGAFVCN